MTGFCYWHYWFAGHQLLQRPFDEVLASGRARLPLLRGLGQPELVGDLARGARPGPDRADLSGSRRRPRALRLTSGPPSRTPATSRIAGRPAAVRLPARRTSPNRHDSSTGGRRWPTMPVSAGCTWWRRSASRTTGPTWSDGFDAAVHYQFPFGRDADAPGCGNGCWPGGSATARCTTPTPTRPPTRRPDSAAGSSRASTRTGTTRPAWADGAWWPPGRPRSGSGATCAGPSSWPRPTLPASRSWSSSRGTSGPRATTSSPTPSSGWDGSRPSAPSSPVRRVGAASP